MKATAIGLTVCVIVIALSAACFAGPSQGYRDGDKLSTTLKVALHLAPHNAKQSCGNMPTFSSRDDIVRQATTGSYDVFVVLFDYGPGISGLEFGLNWPIEWGSAATTHCADFAIGEIVNPRDGMSFTWSECVTSPEYIPVTWSWIAPSSAGQFEITWLAGSQKLMYIDCDFTEFDAESVFFAGIDVVPFEGPWVSTEPTTWGGIKAMFR